LHCPLGGGEEVSRVLVAVVQEERVAGPLGRQRPIMVVERPLCFVEQAIDTPLCPLAGQRLSAPCGPEGAGFKPVLPGPQT